MPPLELYFSTQPPASGEGGGKGGGAGCAARWEPLESGRRSVMSGDSACGEAELSNLRFCSFIRPGQRTNELWPRTVSLVFIFLGRLGGQRRAREGARSPGHDCLGGPGSWAASPGGGGGSEGARRTDRSQAAGPFRQAPGRWGRGRRPFGGPDPPAGPAP